MNDSEASMAATPPTGRRTGRSRRRIGEEALARTTRGVRGAWSRLPGK